MTAVKLTKMWFAPGGTRFREGIYDDMADQLLDHLPSSAWVGEPGGKMIPAAEWQEKHGKKRKATDIESFTPNTVQSAVSPGELAPDPNATSVSVPANAEGASPTSPKSSGPETTALPSDTSKAGVVTASGSEAKKDEHVLPKK